MKILIGCEESQAVTIAFRKLGHEAFSCDLQDCTGGRPEWHIKKDIFEVIEEQQWDMAIFFPPCTYLTVTANKWLKDQPPLKSGALVGKERREARKKAIDFFIKLHKCNIKRIAIENPIGCINTEYMKPTQIIQPYYFGDEARKTTCLWLKNLPPLYHNKTPNLFDENISHVGKGELTEWISKEGRAKSQPKWYANAKHGKKFGERSKERSKTFPAIAKAMAIQWSEFLLSESNGKKS